VFWLWQWIVLFQVGIGAIGGAGIWPPAFAACPHGPAVRAVAVGIGLGFRLGAKAATFLVLRGGQLLIVSRAAAQCEKRK
jgi:hypothetical protein